MINNEIKVLPSTTQNTTTIYSNPQYNDIYKGIRLSLNVSAVTSSPTLDIKLQHLPPGLDPNTNSNWIDITGAAFAQKTGAGSDDLVVYPGITTTASRRVSDVLPRTWRTVATYGGSGTITYSLCGCYQL